VEGENNLTDKMLKFASAKAAQVNTSQTSLFGAMGFAEMVSIPKIAAMEELPLMEVLKREHEVVGFYISGHPLDPFRRDIDKFCTMTCAGVELARNRDIRFAGLVTSRIQKIAKNGNPYCRFSLLDYNGQFEIALFGKDYLKFEQFGREGNLIFVRGENRLRYGSETDYMFNPIEMMLLSDVREKYIKGLELKIKLEEMASIDPDALLACMKRHPGRYPLRIRFSSETEMMESEGTARAFPVNPDETFFEDMQQIGLQVELLT
jgi:DNA polymerase-3 subunit alpha